MTCGSAASCPSATRLDDGTWLVVGHAIDDETARRLGGNPDVDETAVTVPGDVIDQAVSAPLRARIAELEAERARLLDDSRRLAALEAAGVDNWQGYGIAMKIYREGSEP